MTKRARGSIWIDKDVAIYEVGGLQATLNDGGNAGYVDVCYGQEEVGTVQSKLDGHKAGERIHMFFQFPETFKRSYGNPHATLLTSADGEVHEDVEVGRDNLLELLDAVEEMYRYHPPQRLEEPRG